MNVVGAHFTDAEGKFFKEKNKEKKSCRAERDHANLSRQHSVALHSECALQTQWQPQLYQLFICFSSSRVAHIMLQKSYFVLRATLCYTQSDVYCSVCQT